MEQADDGRSVSPPAAHSTTTTTMPISTALSLTASSSHSRSSIFTSNDSFLSSCPTAVNVAAPALHALEQEMLLYRVDLQGAVTASSDRRNRRMIKNRESAARSRARKQAYTHQLEKEVRLLHAENDALREQCEEYKEDMGLITYKPATIARWKEHKHEHEKRKREEYMERMLKVCKECLEVQRRACREA